LTDSCLSGVPFAVATRFMLRRCLMSVKDHHRPPRHVRLGGTRDVIFAPVAPVGYDHWSLSIGLLSSFSDFVGAERTTGEDVREAVHGGRSKYVPDIPPFMWPAGALERKPKRTRSGAMAIGVQYCLAWKDERG
jgi:hypothetical protein